MPLETERKFIVAGEFRDQASGSVEIVQRYLSVDPARTVRIRICNEKAVLTIKAMTSEGYLSRNEWETELELDDAEQIMNICIPGKVVKTRYYVPAGEHIFEVDVFHEHNEGLVIAEVELSYPGEPFTRPGWLGEEVTGNPAYYNSNLIK